MSGQMKVGIQLPEVEREVTWREVREIAITAEEVGFDSIWVGDHLLFRDQVTGVRGPMEAWSMLAALGEATERALIGPLVASTSFHNPAMIAKKAATVDDISGGRLVLGLGAGWNEPEYAAFGFPFDHRVSRFEEAFTIIRTLIREGSIDYHGRFYTHREMTLLPGARAEMPLLIGSNGPRMLRIATPHIDLWNSWYTGFDNDPDGLHPLLETLDAACRQIGRDPAEIERTAAVLVQLERGSGRIAGSSERPEVTPITGSISDIAESLARFEDAGITHIQLVLDPIDAVAVTQMGEVLARFR
ncbi:MAG: LLM class flavin-dependent oxidoreductase [Acidimicrobiia bacterium]|jgi:alkanesulfonate monooxygenase SsuD/methylene tetrahydromethanopterin reductase-like flavin-dependent oxidoreductase (luciferase family)